MSLKKVMTGLFFGAVVLSGCSDSNNEEGAKESILDAEVELVEEASADTNVDEQEKQTAEVPEGHAEFEGISYYLPEGAEQVDIPDQGLPAILYLLDEVDRSNFNIVVEQLPSPMTLQEYMDAATALTGFDYSSLEYHDVNGIEWNEAISFNEEQGAQLNQRTFIHGEKAYVFTYASHPDDYEKYLGVYNTITESVSIIEQ